MKWIFFLVLLLSLYCCTSKQCIQNFSFEFPLSVTSQDTFNVGDTIWFEMEFNVAVLDEYSQEYYDLTHLDLYFTFLMQKLDTNYIFNPMESFNRIEVEGIFTLEGGLFKEYKIEFRDKSNPSFKFGLVPTQSGKFEVGFSLPLEIYYLEMGEYRGRTLVVHPSNCDQYMFPYSSVVTNNGMTNRHLRDSGHCYQFSPTDTTTSCIGNDDVPLSGRGTFAFVVR